MIKNPKLSRLAVSLLLALSLVCAYHLSFAQPGDPGGDPDVPISGVGILIMLGGALGIRKILGRGKRKE